MTNSTNPNKSALPGGAVFEFPAGKRKFVEPETVHQSPTLDLLKHLPDGHFKQYVGDVAKMCYIHPSTSLLVALGIVSAVASRAFAVQYENGALLPTSEYVISGGVPGSGKSRMLGTYQMPIFKAQKSAIKDYKRREAEAAEAGTKFDDKLPASIFLSDSTMEGLEPMLMRTGGFFALASAEQAVVNTLVGASYGGEGKKNNNDLALKGFNGEYHSSSRSTRSGYTGDVVGVITCFAQEGAIETILGKSEGSGMAERFLLLAEPTLLGTRDHTCKHYPQEYSQNVYNRIVGDLAMEVLTSPTAFEDLPAYRISKNDWNKISLFRNEIEPYLADGDKFSTLTMRGIASKVDMHVMKIGALLACLHECPIGVIDSIYIDAAIGIMRDMLDYILCLLFKIGVVGFNAEEESIIGYLGDHRGATSRQVQQAKAKVKPFREAQKPYEAIRQTIDRLIHMGVVSEIENFDIAGNSTGKKLNLIS